MIIRAVRTQIRLYEVDKKNYPDYSTEEQIVDIDIANAKDDPDLFFDEDDVADNITIEVVVDMRTSKQKSDYSENRDTQMKCKCIYGLIFALDKRAHTRLVRRSNEIMEHSEYKFKYPNAPERLMVFKYCPKCGEKIN